MYNQRLERFLGLDRNAKKTTDNKVCITGIHVSGFKSLKDFEFKTESLNIIGGDINSGKSNLLSFFSLIGNIFSGKLQEYVAYSGGADEILTNGAEQTREITFTISIDMDGDNHQYQATLMFAKPNRLVFKNERIKTSREWRDLGNGHEESLLIDSTNPIDKTLTNALKQIRVYQFNNTGDRSNIRLHWPENDGVLLKLNGQNLGSFLYNFQKSDSKSFDMVIRAIRELMPNFVNFDLQSENNMVLLRWKEKNTQKVFSSFQASDNTLRILSVLGFLLQPINKLPSFICIDDIDLGMNQKALSIINEILRRVSKDVQVFVTANTLKSTITASVESESQNTTKVELDTIYNTISSPRKTSRIIKDVHYYINNMRRFIDDGDYESLSEYVSEYINTWNEVFSDEEMNILGRFIRKNHKLQEIISKINR